MASTKIVLSNGREIANLKMNGNNFVSRKAVTEELFEGVLSPVRIDCDGVQEIHPNMELVQITQVDGEYWFVLRDIPQKELDDIQIRADVDFIAMMADIEL